MKTARFGEIVGDVLERFGECVGEVLGDLWEGLLRFLSGIMEMFGRFGDDRLGLGRCLGGFWDDLWKDCLMLWIIYIYICVCICTCVYIYIYIYCFFPLFLGTDGRNGLSLFRSLPRKSKIHLLL